MLSLIAMAQLIVRNIDKGIVKALRSRAARHGRSAEAEHREILRDALSRGTAIDLKQHLLAMPAVGRDREFRVRRGRARRVEL
jgi:plasmid stability protein